MKADEGTKLWIKKTYNPYYTLMANGTVKFDDRITQKDFMVMPGDWVIFQLWSETNRIFMKQSFVKAIDFVRNTSSVSFWKDYHKEFPGITIMQFADPECPKCGHRVIIVYDEDEGFDTSYFQCVPPAECDCKCDEEINLHYENA